MTGVRQIRVLSTGAAPRARHPLSTGTVRPSRSLPLLQVPPRSSRCPWRDRGCDAPSITSGQLATKRQPAGQGEGEGGLVKLPRWVSMELAELSKRRLVSPAQATALGSPLMWPVTAFHFWPWPFGSWAVPLPGLSAPQPTGPILPGCRGGWRGLKHRRGGEDRGQPS